MRFTLFAGIIIILILLLIPIACANPAIMISNYELSPEILMPGDSAVLTLTITNAETSATQQTVSTSGGITTTTTKTIGATINEIRILTAYDGGKEIWATSKYEDIGYLAPGASLPIKFKMIAEDGIREGLYFPIVTVDVQSYQDVVYPILIKISNASVDLLSTSVPSKISMSGSTDITLTAVNNRDASVDGISITPKEVTGVEFIPDSIFIGTLGSDESEDVSFSLRPSETGLKNISFDISFKNGDNLHNKTLDIPIEIIDTLDVAPVLYSIPSSIGKGESTRIRLEVFNAKTSEITGVIITPITKAGISPSQYFIGSMDPDDVFSASFDLSTENLNLGNYTIGFKVSFKQGENYYETPAVSSSFSVVEAAKGGGDSNLGITIGGVLGITIVALFLFFMWKKRRTSK